MQKPHAIRWAALTAGAALLAWGGCSDDGTPGPGGGTPDQARYTITARFGGPHARGGFEVAIARADSADTSAMAAAVTLNGTAIPLRSSASDADSALYVRSFLGYDGGGEYLLTVDLADSSDTAAFVAPELPAITIDAPEDGAEFTPGLPLPINWSYDGQLADSVYLEFVSDGSTAPEPGWVALPGTTTTYSLPASTTTEWEETADLFITLYRGGFLGGFRGHLTGSESCVAASVPGPSLSVQPAAGLPPGVPLAAAISAAPPGEAHGHSFAHLLDLDPDSTYVGGAAITEDTCIRGHGATINLAGESIVVLDTWQARFDVAHCLIVNGSSWEQSAFSGGIEYQYFTRGWVYNNTFYNNFDYAIYADQLNLQGDGVKVINNVFYGNGWSIVRNTNQSDIYIRHNTSWPGPISAGNYGEHTGCAGCNPTEITPGEAGANLHVSNRIEDPGFVETPDPPKVPGDLHLAAGSPCIGTGEDPLTGAVDGSIDKGAFPYTGAR